LRGKREGFIKASMSQEEGRTNSGCNEVERGADGESTLRERGGRGGGTVRGKCPSVLSEKKKEGFLTS